MKKLFLALTAAISIFASCSKENLINQEDKAVHSVLGNERLSGNCGTNPKFVNGLCFGTFASPVGDVTVSNDATNTYVNLDFTSYFTGSSFISVDIKDCTGNSIQAVAVQNEPNSYSFQFPSAGITCITMSGTMKSIVDGTTQMISFCSPINYTLYPCVVNTCNNFRTQTQGGWGASPKGNNPAMYLKNNFNAAFPNGLTVGCNYTIKLSSATAVELFLPQGGTPAILTQNYTNTTNSISVLAGQVVALKISVTMDALDPNFSASTTSLGNLIISSGTFAGWTVNQLLAEGEKMLGGCGSTYSASDLNAALTAINESFVDGVSNGAGFLRCP